MSIRVSSRVWDTFPGSGSELLAMLALADWCDDAGGNLFPSIAAVAEKMRCSESQARRVLHGLIAQGWLAVVANAAGGAPGSTRQYRINLSKLTNVTTTARADATRRVDDSGVEQAHTGGMDARGITRASRPKASNTQRQGHNEAGAVQTGSAGATRQHTATGGTHAMGGADATPGMDARDGSHGCAETGSTGDTQYCHLSVSEPSSSAQARDDDGSDLTTAAIDAELNGFARIPAKLDRQVLARFVRHRRVGRRPLSISSWLQLLPRFAELEAQGHDLTASLRQTMAAGLYLPVTPTTSTTNTNGHHHGESLADRAARQHHDQRNGPDAEPHGDPGLGGFRATGVVLDDVIDAEWRAVAADA